MKKNHELTQEERKEFDNLVIKAMVYGYLIHTNTDYCVFIDFSGHVDSIEISLRESQTNYHEKVCETEMYSKFKEYHDDKEVMFPYLRARVDILKRILDDNDIPYGEMEENIEQVRSYYF